MSLREAEMILVLDWLDQRGLKDGDAKKAIISEIGVTSLEFIRKLFSLNICSVLLMRRFCSF